MQAGPQEFSAANDGVDFETRVRNLAYDLWQKEGEPDGRGDEFWMRAEARIRAEDAGEFVARDPDDAHDATAGDSFPASDPPSTAAPATNLRSGNVHELKPDEQPVDGGTQEDAGVERKKAGGYS